MTVAETPVPASIDATAALLGRGGYVAGRGLATALFLSMRMNRPLFLEGDAGTGKTEIARVLANQTGRRLVRLQCHEGLDSATAVYEWDYARQMMEIRLAEAAGNRDRQAIADGLFSERFLIRRPILQALDTGGTGPAVLLIDELDRADEPFEAFLLEILADFQVTVPELGTIRSATPPLVVITSNRTREIHDAVKRRCLYCWVDYPDAGRELEILKIKAPEAPGHLSRQIVAFIQALREMDLFKSPGVAETIDWAHALLHMDCLALDNETVNDTLGTILKYQDDIARVQGSEAARILRQIEAEMGGAPPG